MKTVFERYFGPTIVYAIFAVIPAISVVSTRPLGSLVAAMALVLLALDFFLRDRRPCHDRNLALTLCLIAMLCLASRFWAEWPANVASQVAKIIYSLLGGYALITWARQQDVVLRAKVGTALAVSFIAACLLIVLEQMADAPLYRLTHGLSFGDHLPRSLTNHAIITFSLLIWPIMHGLRLHGRKNTARYCIAIWVLLVVFLGKSATATLAILAGLGLYALFPLAPKVVNKATGLASAAIIVAIPWLSPWLFGQGATVLNLLKGANAAERLEIWNAASKKVMLRPYTGWGLEASRHFKDLQLEKIYFKESSILHPHNAALQSWVEFGALGAGLAVFLCLFTLRRIARLPLPEQRTATALYGVTLTVMMVGYGTWQGWWLGVVFVSIAAFILAQNKNPSAGQGEGV